MSVVRQKYKNVPKVCVDLIKYTAIQYRRQNSCTWWLTFEIAVSSSVVQAPWCQLINETLKMYLKNGLIKKYYIISK